MTKKVLLSVHDKTGLVEFAQGLHDAGYEFIASGGTGRALADGGFPVTTTEDLTGLPGILGGRVKTLHPALHGGILARDTETDRTTLTEHGFDLIDMVVVNLYPFLETIQKPDVTEADAIEQIDIGGVALIRAAAKNYNRVTVVTDPSDYARVLDEIRKHGEVTLEARRAFARRAFEHTANYDTAIAGYFGKAEDAGTLPETIGVTMPRARTLRYGENPHQQAAYYAPEKTGPLGGTPLQGKPLSYNNLLDVDAAWAAAVDFSAPTMVIVKHLSPCGIASGEDLPNAFRRALASDPVSAFGGVIACNRPVDGRTVQAFGDLFVECIAAPVFSPEARELLEEKKNVRVLQMGNLPAPAYNLRSVRGGILAQTPDDGEPQKWEVVTSREPNEVEEKALHFAWQAVKHVKSNAIVFATEAETVGIGGGLPSRVDAVKLAAEKAGEKAKGAVMASDAFFPFPDGPEAAAAAGVTAIVQPGGSIRDEAVIEVCNKLGIAMVFTGTRHFRH